MSANDNDDQEQDKKRNKRRSVVKGVTIAGTGFTLTHWTKPVVESVVLPAHAQVSPGGVFTAAANNN